MSATADAPHLLVQRADCLARDASGLDGPPDHSAGLAHLAADFADRSGELLRRTRHRLHIGECLSRSFRGTLIGGAGPHRRCAHAIGRIDHRGGAAIDFRQCLLRLVFDRFGHLEQCRLFRRLPTFVFLRAFGG
jgi:hypothetical protein